MHRNRHWSLFAIPLALTLTGIDSFAQGKGRDGLGPDKAREGMLPVAPAQRPERETKERGKTTRETSARERLARERAGSELGASRRPDKKGPADPGGASAPRRGNSGRSEVLDVRRGRGRGPGPSPVAMERANTNARFKRDLQLNDLQPSTRKHFGSSRAAEHFAAGAVAYGIARGTSENTFVLSPMGRDFQIRSRDGRVLVGLDDDAARNLGAWRVTPFNESSAEGSPKFCRTGEGHPVWGRQWCLDKKFGLGDGESARWGRASDLGDIRFSRDATAAQLTREALLGLLGPVAFNRLALHAVTLGYAEPLTGRWQHEANSPGVLLVNSGNQPVAELVDTNSDWRADLLLVALRTWLQ